MAQQKYIDENGNEIPISGTVTSADMLPIEAGSSKMTSEAIGDLSDLTTSVNSSLVGAVNEVVRDKQDKLLIQQGEVSGTGGILHAGNESFTVTFPRSYASTPYVAIFLRSSDSQFINTELQKCCVVSVTATQLNVISSCASSRYGSIGWLAIGYE